MSVSDPRRSPVLPAVLVLCAVLAVALFLYPAWIIQPFRAQDSQQLKLAIAVRTAAPWLTIVLMIVGITAAWRWRPRRWRIALAALALLVTGAATVLARVNYFEFMFHPDPNPHFVAAQSAQVDPDDMVLVARVGSEARAYPVRTMAYHHLVNDALGGVPLVATY